MELLVNRINKKSNQKGCGRSWGGVGGQEVQGCKKQQSKTMQWQRKAWLNGINARLMLSQSIIAMQKKR